MSNESNRGTLRLSWQMVVCLAFIAVAFALLDYYTPLLGDDLAKWDDLGRDSYRLFSLETVRFVGSHYLTVNGRLIDSLGPALTFGIGTIASSALMGLMGAFYFLILLASADVLRKGRVALGYAIVAFTILVMPWWDSMWLRVCQFGYMWATALSLLYFYIFLRVKRPTTANCLLCIAIGFLTGFSHEQAGLSTLFAVVVYMLIGRRYKHLNRPQKFLTVSLILGVVCILANPMLWHRVGTSSVDVPVWRVLLSTLPVVCVLFVVILVMSLTKGGRRRLGELMSTPWAVYVSLAFAGAAFAVYSRIIGRVGWLPETASIIALVLMADVGRFHIKRINGGICASVLLAAIMVHFVAAIKLQYSLCKEYDRVIEEYVESEDGLVYKDITLRPDYPLMALNHAQGVPDADDLYLLNVIERVYRGDSMGLTVLPARFRGNISGIKDTLTFSDVTVYRHKPSVTVLAVGESGCDTIEIIKSLDIDKILKPFKPSGGHTMWAATPLVVDKGDHWTEIHAHK